MIKYGFFEQDSLLIIKYSGMIDKDYLSSFMDFIYLNTNKKNLQKVLTDFRDVNIVFNLLELKDILKLRVTYSDGFNFSLKSVYIVKEVKETVFTTLYAKDIPSNIANVDICSTLEYAIKYLNIKMSNTELEDRIKSLENKFLMN